MSALSMVIGIIRESEVVMGGMSGCVRGPTVL